MPSPEGERAIKESLAQIRDSSGNIRGCGLLVHPHYVVTCAHVVGNADKSVDQYSPAYPQVNIEIWFPFRKEQPERSPRIIAWQPVRRSPTPGDIDDVAVLALTSPLSAPAATPISVDRDWAGRKYMVHGFPGG